MDAYAVIQSGGKQYRVSKGETVVVDQLDAEAGAVIEMKPVLALSDGKELKIGTPELAGSAIKAEVLRHVRGPKVVSYKKRRRKGYARKMGHRQAQTVVRISELV